MICKNVSRQKILRLCNDKTAILGRLVLDTMEDEGNISYGAQPDRLFIIGGNGRIAYVGARGPFGYDVSGVEKWIQTFMSEQEEN